MSFGSAPSVIGLYQDIDCNEMMFWLYVPIKTPNSDLTVPAQLQGFLPLLGAALSDFGSLHDQYVYLTAKTLWCETGCTGGRPGWHTDGFGTDDINYIWSDRDSTEFCIQDGLDISSDEYISLSDMDRQCRNVTTFADGTLFRIDQHVIHRVPDRMTAGKRSFFRVSISKDRYNFLGNSINHGLSERWSMVERSALRNPTRSAA